MIDQIACKPKEYLIQQKDLQQSKIKELLKTSFEKLAQISPSNVQLSSAHQQICSAMEHPLFLQSLSSLLLQSQLNQSNFVKQILTAFTTYIRNQQARSSAIKRADCIKLNNTLVCLYLNEQIADQYRQILLKAYSQFIYANGMTLVRTQTIESICNAFDKLTADFVSQREKQDFLKGEVFANMTLYVSLVHTLIKGPMEQNLLQKVLKTFLFPILTTTYLLISSISTSITFQNQTLFIQSSLKGEKFIAFLKAMATSTSKQHLSAIRSKLLINPLLLSLLKTSLALSVQSHKQSQFIQLVIQSKGNSHLQRINEIKKNAIDIIDLLAKFTLAAQESPHQIRKREYQIPCQIIKFLLESVTPVFVNQFQLLEYPKNQLPHKGIYMSLLKALARIVKIFEFYSQSQALRNSLIFNLCLPLLQRPQYQKITAAADFIGSRQDILNMHAAQTPQNAVCILIQAYLDSVDGSLSHFSNQIVNMILCLLDPSYKGYRNLPAQLSQTYFFKNTSCANQIECGLTVLTLLSYMAPVREDIVEQIQLLLLSHSQFFLNHQNPGTFKSAVLLCYTYYLDNFYNSLASKRTFTRNFHNSVLEACCLYIRQYTGLKQKSCYTKQHLILLQVGALQALDCLSNMVTQPNFLSALFLDGESIADSSLQVFTNVFSFLIQELNHELNVSIINILIQFYTAVIKHQYEKVPTSRQFHYQYTNIPEIVQNQLCRYVCPQLYKLHNYEYIPNKQLIHTKAMTLLQLVMTCCSNPQQYINQQFFSLQIQQQSSRDRLQVLDIFLRRAVVLKQQGQLVHYGILENIVQFCGTFTAQVDEITEVCDLGPLFGIYVNLIVINEQIVDRLIIPLGTLLNKLLYQEEQTEVYRQSLQEAIQKCSYILLIGIHLNLSQSNSHMWQQLVDSIYLNLLQKQAAGLIVCASSSTYIGKLLALCKCSFDQDKINFLWSSAIQTQRIYKSSSQKLIVALEIINLLSQRQTISLTDMQSRRCFNMLCGLLHSVSSRPPKNQTEQQSDCQDSGESDSSAEQREDEVNYKEYTIACNQYVFQDELQRYLLIFKELCHKLKVGSPEFLKGCLDQLTVAVSSFVKQKAFYFQGNLSEKGLRIVIKVKK